MLKYFAAIWLIIILISAGVACRKQGDPSPAEANVSQDLLNFLGVKRIQIIADSERVACYRLHTSADESSESKFAGFPIHSQGPDLNEKQIKTIRSLIFDDNSYHFGVEKSCKFRPELGLRFFKGQEHTDLLVSFMCDLWMFVYEQDQKIEDCDPVKEKLTALAFALFPGDK